MDEIKLAFDSYVDWESSGGKELLLGANRLTNRQLFWLAFARSRYVKRSKLPDQFHVLKDEFDLNSFDSIKETFNCKEKNNLVTVSDSCSENYLLMNRPIKNNTSQYFKNTRKYFGFINSLNDRF